MFSGIRPSDHLLTGLMVALAALLGVENVTAASSGFAHPLDSRSVLIVPVFVLAALPVLWRRRFVLPAIVVSTLVLAASLAAFGWLTRCGFALPLAAVFAYAVARFGGTARAQLLGLAAIGVHEVVSLVMDASTDGLSGPRRRHPAGRPRLRRRGRRREALGRALRRAYAVRRARQRLRWCQRWSRASAGPSGGSGQVDGALAGVLTALGVVLMVFTIRQTPAAVAAAIAEGSMVHPSRPGPGCSSRGSRSPRSRCCGGERGVVEVAASPSS